MSNPTKPIVADYFQAILEFRSGTVEAAEFMDKESGQNRSYIRATLNFETDTGRPVVIKPTNLEIGKTDKLSFDQLKVLVAGYTLPYRKGQKYMVQINNRKNEAFAADILGGPIDKK